MLQTIKRIAIGASMVASASVLATAPALAASLTGATIGGTAASDYLVYGVSGNNTVVIPNTPANVQSVLDGNAASPTGNVELRASTEKASFSGADFAKNTTLSGNIGGKALTLSSLTAQDWFGGVGLPTAYGAANLANKWFNDFITKAGYGAAVGTGNAASMYNLFLGSKGFQASSDPNISYVNQNDNTGLISIGLAGHYDVKAAYASNPSFAIFANLLPNGFQASEVVKYTYNGVTDYLYSFNATNSGLVAADDGKSHNGNYEVTIAGVPTVTVPEPSSLLGLMAVGGLFAATKRKSAKTA
ncbi:NF038130 family PEP-CTERM protein [Argonema galeatum]|uniref:NF038130 family PEP-CTERM protein n=1 Tax=Argonema galeatum TaxID=2942762 RepID=UPI0020137477|nr:NF038130 family PEP-CTERM protein [Argonema galeatum]MCL1466280.1 NF038130 family PEP-CTERM protein [Argonema galeatum A003/A1]